MKLFPIQRVTAVQPPAPVQPSTVNAAGLAMLTKWEGLRLTAYPDQAEVWTIGYGHTPAKPGQVITKAQAVAYLRQDIGHAEAAVYGYTHDVPTTGNQFSAMVSLTYNIGVGAFHTSSVLRQHRAKNYPSAAADFALWDKAHINGRLVVDGGLLNRRRAEAALYETPV